MAKALTTQMNYFYWQGIDHQGKRCSGMIMALTETEARTQLKQGNIRLTHLSRKNRSWWHQIRHRIKAQDITLLTRQLATMLTTGVPLIQALSLVSDNPRSAAMKALILQLKQRIESGTPLPLAFQIHHHFDELYIELLRAAELSGNLAQIFQRLAEHREKSHQLKSKMRKASIYPSMVLVVSGLVTYLMLALVIPEFEILFNSFGADLPWFTQQVLYLSHVVQQSALTVCLLLVTLVVATRWLSKRNASVSLTLSRFSQHMPILAKMKNKAFVARYCRTLATSITAGIPLLSCLHSASNSQHNPIYQQALRHIHQETSAGMPLYLAMRHCQLFSELTLQMVMIGEESGRLDDMLCRLATLYENELDEDIENLTKLLEPIIIVVLSVIVASLVLAIYLPIFNLMNVIG
ncbi:type II secretion system F family protein [Vibrio ponticus]|nr:type II secretion system F family protein [Vibrio ponticus]